MSPVLMLWLMMMIREKINVMFGLFVISAWHAMPLCRGTAPTRIHLAFVIDVILQASSSCFTRPKCGMQTKHTDLMRAEGFRQAWSFKFKLVPGERKGAIVGLRVKSMASGIPGCKPSPHSSRLLVPSRTQRTQGTLPLATTPVFEDEREDHVRTNGLPARYQSYWQTNEAQLSELPRNSGVWIMITCNK